MSNSVYALPSNLSQTIAAVGAQTNEQLRASALQALENGEELSDEQLQAISVVEAKEFAAAQEQHAEERAAEEAEAEANAEFVFKKEIETDGQKEVFIGRGASEREAIESCLDAVAKGKSESTKHIRRLNAELANRKSKLQEDEDNSYVKQQRLKELENDPFGAIDQRIETRLAAERESQQKEQAAIQRSREAQEL